MYIIEKLENGLTVVLEELPFVRSIAFGLWVHNGSRNETPELSGMSHFIEHMLFKGTEKRSAKRIADEMDGIGGQMNAYTTKEHTCFYTRVLDEHFDQALDIIADMFFNSKLDEAEIQKERNVILEEINMYEDTPEDLAHDSLQSQAFSDDSLGMPILGTEATIFSFTQKTFRDYMNSNYCPENTLLAFAGNFKAEEIIAKIKPYFGGFKPRGYKRPVFKASYSPCLVTREKDIEQLHICLGFPGINIDSPDTYALSVFNTLFGGGMSSRLFQNIREDKGLVYSIYSYAQSYTDTGIYSIYAALNPKLACEAVKNIRQEVNAVLSERISDEQLERTKEQLKSNYMMSLESTMSRMNSIGRSQLLLGHILSPDELIAKVEAVTADDVLRLIRRVLDFKSVSLSAVGKTAGIDFGGMLRNEC